MDKPNNSVAEYKVIKENCEICDGNGALYNLTPERLFAVLRKVEEIFPLSSLKLMLKDIKEDNQMSCPVCDGKGWMERWI